MKNPSQLRVAGLAGPVSPRHRGGIVRPHRSESVAVPWQDRPARWYRTATERSTALARAGAFVRSGLGRSLVSGGLALLMGATALAFTVAPFGWRLSAAVRMAQNDPIARLVKPLDPGWAWASSHYDGIYFYAIARDPLATGGAHRLIDAAAYRYGHPGYGWIAGLLAGFDPRWLPLTLVLSSLAACFIAGFAAARVGQLLGSSGTAGFLVALNPGLLFAAANDTSEAVGSALLLVTLWAWLAGRHRLAALLIVPLCFMKEPLLLVPLGLAAWETLRMLHGGPREAWLRRLAVLVPGPLLYVAWVLWLHAVFGAWSFAGKGLLTLPLPFLGWFRTIRLAANLAVGPFPSMQVGEAMVPILLVAIASVAFGLLRAGRLRSPVDAVFVLLAALVCFLAWRQLLYPKDLIRSLTFVWILLPLVIAAPRFGRTTRAPEAEG